MQKFKVAACLEIGFYLEIEATDQKSAEALMMDMIKDEDIPIIIKKSNLKSTISL